ncbi:hypothetical protein AWC15_09225 [Mycobacterium lacus]|nr:hypothetical protein AWC15_09225 [Mycobacterium lacus]
MRGPSGIADMAGIRDNVATDITTRLSGRWRTSVLVSTRSTLSWYGISCTLGTLHRILPV